jgi:hypothetical protein
MRNSRNLRRHGHAEYRDHMNEKKMESRKVMPNATKAEIEEATRRWFGFLQTVDRIAQRLEREDRDSHDSAANDRFDDLTIAV